MSQHMYDITKLEKARVSVTDFSPLVTPELWAENLQVDEHL